MVRLELTTDFISVDRFLQIELQFVAYLLIVLGSGTPASRPQPGRPLAFACRGCAVFTSGLIQLFWKTLSSPTFFSFLNVDNCHAKNI